MIDHTIMQALDEVFTPEAKQEWMRRYFRDDAFKTSMERDLLAAAYVRRLCFEAVDAHGR